jgi:hypothetical protein
VTLRVGQVRIDPDPHDEGTVALVDVDGAQVAVVLADAALVMERFAGTDLYRLHPWSSCVVAA